MRQARLEGIIEQMERRFESIDRRFEFVERRLDAIERRLITLESSIRQGFFWIVGLMFTSWLSIVGLILWKLG